MTHDSKRWSPPRESARYALDERLIVRGARTLHGRTKDICESGLGATVAGELALGESVELQFYLPGSFTPLTLPAEVRYRKGFQYGFFFLAVSERQKALIRGAALRLKLAP